MTIAFSLTKRETEAVLRAHLSVGYGVHRSHALESAEFKLFDAILRAQREASPEAAA